MKHNEVGLFHPEPWLDVDGPSVIQSHERVEDLAFTHIERGWEMIEVGQCRKNARHLDSCLLVMCSHSSACCRVFLTCDVDSPHSSSPVCRMTEMFTSVDFRRNTFSGFVEWSQFSCSTVPHGGGVYVVLRPSGAPPPSPL